MQSLYLTAVLASFVFLLNCNAAPVFDLETSDSMCTFCTRNINRLLNNQTLNAALTELEWLADKLPDHLGMEIKPLLIVFGPDLIQMVLKHLNAKSICTEAFHFCSENGTQVFGSFQINADTAKCEACKIGIDILDGILMSTSIQAEIQKLIQDACGGASGTGQAVCKLFANYVPELMGSLGTVLTEGTLCYDTGVCKS